ncbi:hypothetical protein QJS04_geneDACA016937 [Acorus gramineus]|uniref:Uncharacterized protein n=1 Tax=Acorus gramineus TaxID=55184 RepID=A0AAV9AK62_ACOGR|nr:hypothetical protein QJS04_geneDACA016937 [Acorus gramineus]
MASTDGLVPITRSFLARYYDKYNFVPLSGDVSRFSSELRSMSDDLLGEVPAMPGEETLINEANSNPPHKVDENLWKNRENIEEVLFLLDESHWPQQLKQQSTAEEVEIASVVGRLQVRLQGTLKTLESFQGRNADNIFNTIMTYLPQDFRGTAIRLQRERSERNKQAMVDALVNSGGSIRDKYALLWGQQMERRRQLAQLGSATGVYKTLVKLLVGVPQVLLDFIQQINDDQGKKDHLAILEEAMNIYTSELERFLKFIGRSDDYKETVILAGKTHEDIGFSVEFISPSGDSKGNFCTFSAGCYKLIWDNSYSTFFKKSLRYKVDAIPPVAEIPQSVPEAEQ